MIVDDGFQSGGPAAKEGASHDSRDPVKTVSLTSTTVVRKKVNVTLQQIHHLQLFLESWVHRTTGFFFFSCLSGDLKVCGFELSVVLRSGSMTAGLFSLC